MKKTITQNDFIDAFRNMGRKDQFSYNALVTLYNYLEALDENYDLDVIALCCEYTEATLDEVKSSYPDIDSFEDLEEHTSVIRVDADTVIYANY